MSSRFQRPRAGALGQITAAACVVAAMLGLLATLPVARAQPSEGAPLEISWEDVPLGAGVRRLESAGLATVMLDRRVDPHTRVTCMARGPLADALRAALDPAGYGVSEVGDVVYIGPARTARELRTLAEQNRRALTEAAPPIRRALSRVEPLEWPRLAEPRAIVERVASESGFRLTGAGRIPHDVWPAGRRPAAPLADQLTLLLVGFDLTWRVAQGDAIEITSIDRPVAISDTYRLDARTTVDVAQLRQEFPEAIVSANERRIVLRGVVEAHDALRRMLRGEAPTRSDRAPKENTSGAEQRFTLTVRAQRADAILEQLAAATGMTLQFPPAYGQSAREALTERIDLSVTQATLEELLEAFAKETGVRVRAAGGRLVVTPAE